jgi:hypothetical protein
VVDGGYVVVQNLVELPLTVFSPRWDATTKRSKRSCSDTFPVKAHVGRAFARGVRDRTQLWHRAVPCRALRRRDFARAALMLCV